MKRAVDWPRYMSAKTLANGTVAHYWEPPAYARKAGFSLGSEALGPDYAAARDRAVILNAHLDAWRLGRAGEAPPSARNGTVDWWIDTFLRTERAKARLSQRTLDDYAKALARLAEIATVTGGRIGELPVSSLSPGAVDLIYERLRAGGTVTRQANMTIDVARTAWRRMARAHPGLFMVPVAGANGGVRLAPINPFAGVERVIGKDTARPATRGEAYALADALIDMGHPLLALAPLIAFEWVQRPTNIIGGHIAWGDWRPKDRPGHVRVFHHKTGARVWLPLEDPDTGAPFYPELEARLAAATAIGVPIVLMRPQRGPKRPDGGRTPRPYSYVYAEHLVQRARTAAGLPAHVTLEACRHGGMTELGDAEATEAEIMSHSGHMTASAARLYVKRTERQRVSAARKRRALVGGTKAGEVSE